MMNSSNAMCQDPTVDSNQANIQKAAKMRSTIESLLDLQKKVNSTIKEMVTEALSEYCSLTKPDRDISSRYFGLIIT